MIEIEEGSGNVYADVGAADPEGMQFKAQLVDMLGELIHAQKLNQGEAAKLVGMPQPKLSGLLRGQFRGVSEVKLLDCLRRLGQDIQIVISPAAHQAMPGRLEIVEGKLLDSVRRLGQ